METAAVKLPARSFCADVNAYALRLSARRPHSVTLCGLTLCSRVAVVLKHSHSVLILLRSDCGISRGEENSVVASCCKTARSFTDVCLIFVAVGLKPAGFKD